MIWRWAPAAYAIAPGDALVQLTDERGIDARPAWSPDNRTIAYQSNREGNYHIYLMNPDGTNKRALTQGATDNRHPIWMADGKTILFDSFNGTHREIFSVNVADGNIKQLTRLGASANFPAPSPDGKWMTFYLFKNEVLDLWKARIDGSDAKPLTREMASSAANQCTFACHHAGWSEDGRNIVYSAGELDTIWMVASENGTPQKIIDDGEDNHFPWFLPDGRVGYITEHIEPSNAWTDFWAYDLKTGKRDLLQTRMAMQGPLAWSNDYRRVLFPSPRGGNFDIYLIDLDADGGTDALQGKNAKSVRIITPAPAGAPARAPTVAPQEDNTSLIVGGALGFGAVLALVLFFALRKRK
ncbi:MAG: PD40 domain-containing protein [Chloroflexi bacterium]|nr:PD40 domain-containing protein [Chloroflexota bacterium]